MADLRTFKDGLAILFTFGPLHALDRFRDWVEIKQENKRRNRIYKEKKPAGAVIKDIQGIKMKLNMDDYGIHRDLFLDGIREPVATANLKKALGPDDIVLEIGANIGYYALIESRLCKKVYAVEPVSANIAALRENLCLNQCQNVEVFQMAFADTVGTREIFLSRHSNWHSFFPIKDPIGTEAVATDTVDNFLAEKEPPTFVRMDVEGYELNIIKGMAETLKTIKGLFLEIHGDVLSLGETRELIDRLLSNSLIPSLIVKYDKPGFSKILDNEHLKKIYHGDKGVYEVFFQKQA